jgi:hypothetical protein
MAPDPATADPDLIKLYAFQVFSKLEGAVTAGMIHLGDRLGLYRVLADAEHPLSSTELAAAAGLDERWVREWAFNQAAAKLIRTASDDHGDEVRFALTSEAAAVLATPDHPAFGMGMFHRLPQTMQTLELMPESFRSGLGHDYDSHGPEGAIGLERSFEPWNRTFLLPVVLPALDGVVDKLTEGATVVDIGCGAGGAVLLMAKAFPGQPLQRLRHLAVRARPGGRAARLRPRFQRHVPRSRGFIRCRDDHFRRPRHRRSTVSTT